MIMTHRDLVELLPDPLGEIDQPPADHPMSRRDRPALDNPGQRSALPIVEFGRMARRLAVNQPSRYLGMEPQHPIPDHLQPDTADPRRIRTRAAIINLGQGEKAAAPCRILRSLGQSPQTRTIKVSRKAIAAPMANLLACSPH